MGAPPQMAAPLFLGLDALRAPRERAVFLLPFDTRFFAARAAIPKTKFPEIIFLKIGNQFFVSLAREYVEFQFILETPTCTPPLPGDIVFPRLMTPPLAPASTRWGEERQSLTREILRRPTLLSLVRLLHFTPKQTHLLFFLTVSLGRKTQSPVPSLVS